MQQPGSLIYSCAYKFLAADLICSLLKNAEVKDEYTGLLGYRFSLLQQEVKRHPTSYFKSQKMQTSRLSVHCERTHNICLGTRMPIYTRGCDMVITRLLRDTCAHMQSHIPKKAAIIQQSLVAAQPAINIVYMSSQKYIIYQEQILNNGSN